MDTQLLIAIFAGLGGMFGWGFADFSAKKTIDEIGDVASLAWGHIFGTLILFIFVIYQIVFSGYEISIPGDLNTWFVLLFFGVLQAIVYFYIYKGFGKGQVSVLSPIFATFSGITAILSIVFFAEIVSGSLIFALIVIFSGILLMHLDTQIFQTKSIIFTKIPGFKEIVIATLLASFWTLFWGKFVNGQDWLLYALLMYGFMTIAILMLAKFQKVNLYIDPKSNTWRYLILIGIGEVVAYLAISYGYSLTSHISIIALLSGAFSLPVLVLAHVFLKERVTRMQTIGSIVIILGIMVLALI